MAGKIPVTIYSTWIRRQTQSKYGIISGICTLATLVGTECFQHTPCKGIQDSLWFWIPYHGFRILSTGFQLLVGFQNPKPRIPDSPCKISQIGFHKQTFLPSWSLDYLTWYVSALCLSCSPLLKVYETYKIIFYLRPLPAKTAPTKTAALIPPTFIWNVVSVWISSQNSAWRMIKNK